VVVKDESVNLKLVARPVLQTAARIPPLRRALISWYDGRDSGNGWSREHPYDVLEGIRTSGSVPGFLLRTGDDIDRPTTNYGGCQPSVARHALDQVPEPRRFAFVDLGCGKGRVLAVASEFPFHTIVGIELSPTLADIATHNAAAVAARHPGRTPIAIRTGDAVAVPLPDGPLVVFMYNPFGADVVSRLLARLGGEPDRELFVVYVNPVHGALLDRSPALRRRYAATVPCAPGEIGFGPDADDTVVIWQGGGTAPPTAWPVDRPIVVTERGWRADLGPI
jgi:SAM-dependent methyltransferase